MTWIHIPFNEVDIFPVRQPNHVFIGTQCKMCRKQFSYFSPSCLLSVQHMLNLSIVYVIKYLAVIISSQCFSI